MPKSATGPSKTFCDWWEVPTNLHDDHHFTPCVPDNISDFRSKTYELWYTGTDGTERLVEACITQLLVDCCSATLVFDLLLNGKYEHLLSVDDLVSLGVHSAALEELRGIAADLETLVKENMSSHDDEEEIMS